MSRPEKPIDWDKVDKLLLAGCIGTQIAPHFNIGADRFYDRVKEEYGMGFTEYSSLKKEHGNSLLLAKQMEKAMNGNGDNTMLIWLGKQRLGQKENLENSAPPSDSNLTALINELKELKGKINATEPKTDPELQ